LGPVWNPGRAFAGGNFSPGGPQVSFRGSSGNWPRPKGFRFCQVGPLRARRLAIWVFPRGGREGQPLWVWPGGFREWGPVNFWAWTWGPEKLLGPLLFFKPLSGLGPRGGFCREHRGSHKGCF